MTPIKMPELSKVLSNNGTFERWWHEYIAGIETLSKRVAANSAALDGGATLPDVIAKQNEILAALKAAGLMDKD